MASFKKILCPVDFSDSSKQAFSFAKRLAEAFNAKLHVLHVTPKPPEYYAYLVPEYGVYAPRMEEGIEERMNSFLEDWKGAYQKFVRVGTPYKNVLRMAEHDKYDLIVMGAKGVSPLAPMLVGGTAERVVRGARCPVITVREKPDATIDRVLFCTDLSEDSLKAGPYATTIAEKFGATLYLLHVIELGEPHNEAMYHKLEEQLLKKLKVTGKAKALTVKKMVRRNLEAGMEISNFAREEKIDLVVMTTHGRGGLSRLLLGSVAEKVIRFAPCPVMTVRVKKT